MSLGQLQTDSQVNIAHYEVIRKLSSGTMTDVFEAVEPGNLDRVAIKRLRKEQYRFPHVVKRFQREAMAAASLHHEHIVPVYNVGCHEGQHFYVMKYISGINLNGLRRLIHGGIDTPTALTIRIQERINGTDAVIEIACQVLSALQYAHSLGAIHRGITPTNVLLDSRGKAWVTDFGSVKMTQVISEKLSTSGQMHCRYSSPELILAGDTGEVDPRSDLFSVGAVFFELMTGKISSLSARRIPELPIEFPKTLEAVLRQACDRDRNKRFHTADEFASELKAHRNRASTKRIAQQWFRNLKRQFLNG